MRRTGNDNKTPTEPNALTFLTTVATLASYLVITILAIIFLPLS